MTSRVPPSAGRGSFCDHWVKPSALTRRCTFRCAHGMRTGSETTSLVGSASGPLGETGSRSTCAAGGLPSVSHCRIGLLMPEPSSLRMRRVSLSAGFSWTRIVFVTPGSKGSEAKGIQSAWSTCRTTLVRSCVSGSRRAGARPGTVPRPFSSVPPAPAVPGSGRVLGPGRTMRAAASMGRPCGSVTSTFSATAGVRRMLTSSPTPGWQIMFVM